LADCSSVSYILLGMIFVAAAVRPENANAASRSKRR